MIAFQILNTLLGALAALTLAAQVVRVAAATVRTRQAGAPAALVGADMTSQLIGLGMAVAGAMVGGYAIFSALSPVGLEPVVLLIAQVFAALVGSWLIGWIYFGWVAQPVYRWFTGEEGAGHDG